MQADRQQARELFACLINCSADDLAWIPSTTVGENLIAAALDLGRPGVHIVTDAAHFEPSIHLYERLRERGAEVTVLPLRNNAVDLEELERAMRPHTRLVALSLVSALNGFEHDLKSVCRIAHAHGALVYADIIQAAGAVPVDVRDSGVDFCACSTYKWLMGDFGVGLLYVRPDRRSDLRPMQTGYRQLSAYQTHFLPFDAASPDLFTFERGTGSAAAFEVGTLGNAAVAALRVSLAYLLDTGVANIATFRLPMIERLQQELPRLGFIPLTPASSRGPIVVFAYQDASRLRKYLEDAGIQIQLYEHRIRISPSVYNSMDDIEQLIAVLHRVASQA
jgi:selenocysteine lyase/cysteine desulfurase